MPKQTSAGLLMFSQRPAGLHVLLAHPGGPFFAKKDEGAWSIPKGLVDSEEDLLAAALREFSEETGYQPARGATFLPLGSVTLKQGKEVHAWAFEGQWGQGRLPESNTFSIEWPARSGRWQSFPEVDRAEMFPLDEARRKINERQVPFLDRLAALRETT